MTGNGFKFKLGKKEVISGWDVGLSGTLFYAVLFQFKNTCCKFIAHSGFNLISNSN